MCNPATPALAYCVTVRATFAGPPNLAETKIQYTEVNHGDPMHVIVVVFAYPVSASAMTGTVGLRLQTICAAWEVLC